MTPRKAPEEEASGGPALPYGRQWVHEEDIERVAEVLRSDWLTTGPAVPAFEQAVAKFTQAETAVAVSSGTAALHAAMFAIGVASGDEVVVPAMTFAATANAVVFQGGTPVFADVVPDTLLLDAETAAERVTPRTKAIVAVDYAGQPCDYDALRELCTDHDLWLVADACHALGATYHGRPVGSLADVSAFSFHPVKHITTGEGGMGVTDDLGLADRMRRFRNHGITSSHRERSEAGTWFYEMVDLGYNYRLTDFQAALGRAQLQKLPSWLARRREIASRYDAELVGSHASPLRVREDVEHAYHLYVVAVDPRPEGPGRDEAFRGLRKAGIGVNVHYIPVHLHPFYRDRFQTAPGSCPVAEDAYERILSLPMFPRMSAEDVDTVLGALREVGV